MMRRDRCQAAAADREHDRALGLDPPARLLVVGLRDQRLLARPAPAARARPGPPRAAPPPARTADRSRRSRPSRSSPHAASTTASSPRSPRLRSRVSMFPRSGSIESDGSSASSCARRRTDAVPTRMPGRSSEAPQSASRGSSRSRYAPTDQPVRVRGGHVLRRVHGDVDPPVEQRLLDLLDEDPARADLAERLRPVAVAGRRDRHERDLHPRPPQPRRTASSACVSASREPREPTLSSIALAPAPRQLDELLHLALEPRQLRRDDRHPREHPDEHDQVRGRDVLLAELTQLDADVDRSSDGRERARGELARVSAVPAARAAASSRLPQLDGTSSPRAAAAPAHETQKVKNIEPDICGPCRVKTVGWMKSFASRIESQLDRDQHDPEERVDRAHVRPRRPRLDRVAEHEVGRVEEEQDQERDELVRAPRPPDPPRGARPDRAGDERQRTEDHALVDRRVALEVGAGRARAQSA